MAQDDVVQVRSARARSGAAPRVASWATVVAVLSFLVAAWQVGIWANHWYVAELVYYPRVDEAAKEGPYWDITQLFYSGNVAMLAALVSLTVAALAVGVAVLARRRAAKK